MRRRKKKTMRKNARKFEIDEAASFEEEFWLVASRLVLVVQRGCFVSPQ